MSTLDSLMVKMAEKGINILDAKPICTWDSDSSDVIGYIINYEYQFTGYIDRDNSNIPKTGWRKMCYGYFGSGLPPVSMVEALEEVYKTATKAQDTLAKPLKEREA